MLPVGEQAHPLVRADRPQRRLAGLALIVAPRELAARPWLTLVTISFPGICS